MRLGYLMVGVMWMSLSARAWAEKALVLQSHVGQPTSADAKLLAPALSELRARGAMTDDLAVTAIEERLGADSDLDDAKLESTLAAINAGHDQFTEGHFAEAVRSLEVAVAALKASPATFARKPELRSQLRRGLVMLALAHQRLRAGESATKAMAEVVRGFSDQPFDRATFGPEAWALHQAVARDLRNLAPGTLRVTASDEAATILVNEAFAGVGRVAIASALPGHYRIYAQKGDRTGRLHVVEVAPGGTADVKIAWGLDSTLKSAQGAATLIFSTASEQSTDEAIHSTQIARTIGAEAVIVLRVAIESGSRVVVGTRYSLETAQALRSARVLVEPTPPSPSVLAGLARFLDGEPAAPELDVLAPRGKAKRPLLESRPPTTRSMGRRFGAWKWASLAAGLAALGTGIYLVSIDGPIKDADGNFTPDQYETKTPGIATIALGGTLIATGLAFWIFDRKPATRSTLAVRDDGGFVVSWTGDF